MRGKWLLVSGAAILAAVAAGALSLLWRKSPEPTVVVTQSTAGTPANEVSLPGTIEPREIVSVAAPVDGTLEAFFADEGQEVSEGQLLAQIRSTGLEADREAAASELERARDRANSLESRVIAARLEAARARAEATRARDAFERAEKAYLRQQMLYREGATPRLTYERSQREFEAAKTEHGHQEEIARLAEEQLSLLTKESDTTRASLAAKTRDFEDAGARVAAGEVRSPGDGLIVGRSGRPGETVTTDMLDLFEIAVNLALLQVVVEPPGQVLARIRPGQTALVQVAEVPGEGINGTVREIREGQAVIEFDSPNPLIKPGLTAQVRIRTG